MKFMQLVYFESVCRNGNFSKAAKELYVSQPAISSSVKDLEDELGVRLLCRQDNKLTLTEHGEYFLPKSVALLNDMNNLVREMKGLGDNSAFIKISTPPMIGAIFFPLMYTQFRLKHPNIKVEILEFGSLKARSMLLDNTADIAIAIIDKITERELQSLFLFPVELVFCVSRTHHLAYKESLNFNDLENENIILMKEDSYQNELIRNAFAEKNIEPNVVLMSSQLHTIKNFIAENVGGAFLFKEIAAGDTELRAIPLEEPITLDIGLIWKRESNLFREIKQFIDFVKKFNINNPR